jgi:hypothetical protein
MVPAAKVKQLSISTANNHSLVMIQNDDLLKVGVVAKTAGVGVQKLHYYERLGLLPKPQRSTANRNGYYRRHYQFHVSHTRCAAHPLRLG